MRRDELINYFLNDPLLVKDEYDQDDEPILSSKQKMKIKEIIEIAVDSVINDESTNSILRKISKYLNS